MKKTMLSTLPGLKIRRQYFHIPIYIFLYVIVLVCLMVVSLRPMRLEDGTLTIVDTLSTAAIPLLSFLLPFVILSILNHHLFGEVVAVLDEEGIHTERGFYPWRLVTRIEYEPSLPTRYNLLHYTPNTAILKLRSGNIEVKKAPFRLLRIARRYAPHVKTGMTTFDKWWIGILLALPFILVPLCVLFGR